ncbi:MAG: type III pantothenate kinase [Collinsella intestinalis]|jgi:pantothenate kinase type III
MEGAMDVDMEATGARPEGPDSRDRVLQAQGISEPSTASCLLAVDVGNTVTKFGVFAADELAGTWEVTTSERCTADEAWAQAACAIDMLGAPEPASAILSCVVPSLAEVWRSALGKLCGARPYVVGPGLKTGIRMRYDDPSEVGSDRVADAVAARETYGAPVVVVDLGTTTNIEVVDESGAFAGGIIAPGVALGARSLTAAAARLPMIELRAPERVIGRSTRSAMQSGVVLGEAARIGGLLDAVMDELGTDAPVVITGDGAAQVAALISHDAVVDETLTLRGLHHIWLRNRH